MTCRHSKFRDEIRSSMGAYPTSWTCPDCGYIVAIEWRPVEWRYRDGQIVYPEPPPEEKPYRWNCDVESCPGHGRCNPEREDCLCKCHKPCPHTPGYFCGECATKQPATGGYILPLNMPEEDRQKVIKELARLVREEMQGEEKKQSELCILPPLCPGEEKCGWTRCIRCYGGQWNGPGKPRCIGEGDPPDDSQQTRAG
jgi:hypothetical protein